MKIRKFVARDYQTAIGCAKKEMGPDAIILHTRQIKKGGWLGFFLPARVEITVALDDTLQVNTDKGRTPFIKEQGTVPLNKPVSPKPLSLPEETQLLAEMQSMRSLMAEIKAKMYEVEIIKGMSEQVQCFYENLVKSHVDRELALKIASSVETRLPKEKAYDQDWAREVCLHTLQEFIKEAQPIETKSEKKGRLVFFVGPTGVGKTTTIAKLAANMTFLERKNVALITMDTYRVSAPEQLRTFAEIIGIPISVVFDPQEMKEAINRYREKDIIFVDTAGRSPHNEEHMGELRRFVQEAQPEETILVLSATTDSSDLIATYYKFSTLRVDKLIFTKLDETYNYGQIFNALYEIKRPIAYLTNGQSVPDDIQVPDPLELAKLLLRRENNERSS